jgi:hypothetical protein
VALGGGGSGRLGNSANDQHHQQHENPQQTEQRLREVSPTSGLRSMREVGLHMGWGKDQARHKVAHALKKLRSAAVVSAVPPSQLAALLSSFESDPAFLSGGGGSSEQNVAPLRRPFSDFFSSVSHFGIKTGALATSFERARSL